MTQKKKILVVGCGIGGATVAYALSRSGHAVDSIDNKQETAVAGAGICLLFNTVRALASLGLAEACLDSGLAYQTYKEHDDTGQVLMRAPIPQGCGMRRPELARILENAAADSGAVLQRGLTVQNLVNGEQQVEVTFSDGRQQVYDLVVAADGAYSKLRERVFGAQYKNSFVGQSAWRFNAPRPSEVDGLCIYRSSDKQRTVGALPTSKESCYFFMLENSEQHLHMPEEQLHTLVRERVQGFSAPVIREAVDRLSDASHVTFRPFDAVFVPAPWHRGRVVLLGDAAHTPTPQLTSGAGMAIEDAVVLADCLKEQESLSAALQAYSQRRFERVKLVWDTSLQLCELERHPAAGTAEQAAQLMHKAYQYLAQPI
jgi:2-polyprenyl-6-methoxyphenol hydroxylase-like FAD-dependent oxidoreductase